MKYCYWILSSKKNEILYQYKLMQYKSIGYEHCISPFNRWIF